MKASTTYLLFTAFSLMANSLVAQPPPPPILFSLPTTTALWAENTSVKYAMDGDTTINNVDYKKIWTSDEAVFNLSGATYHAALREEPAGVVKAVMAGMTNEVILYNFNLYAGLQSEDVYLHGYGTVNVTVVGYDSIQVETEMRPVYIIETDQGYQYEWIGGIGSKRGLFTPAANFDPVEELYCFHQNDTLVYLRLGVADCNTTAIEERETASIELYPNPSKGEIQVNTGFEVKNASLIITDAKGSIVDNRQLGRGSFFIISDLGIAPGLYFYHLFDEGVVKKSGKLIFQ